MDFHQVIYPICSVFVAAPTFCVLDRISYSQFPGSKLKTYGDRRFSTAGPKLWNSMRPS